MSLEIIADFERFTETLEEALSRFDTFLYEDLGTD
jgi:cytochrome c peroxidase